MKKTKIFDSLDNVIGNWSEGKATDKDVVSVAIKVNEYLVKNAHPHDVIDPKLYNPSFSDFVTMVSKLPDIHEVSFDQSTENSIFWVTDKDGNSDLVHPNDLIDYLSAKVYPIEDE